MDGASSIPETIEWSNFNDCIKWIHSSGRPIAAFVSPRRLAKIALLIVEWVSLLLLCWALDRLCQCINAVLLPNIFTVVLSRPLLSYTIQGTDTEGVLADKIRYHEVSNWNIDLIAPFCSRFAMPLQYKLRDLYDFEHPAIRASVLGGWGMVECCNLIKKALDTYRDGYTHYRPFESHPIFPAPEYVVTLYLSIIYILIWICSCACSVHLVSTKRVKRCYFSFLHDTSE